MYKSKRSLFWVLFLATIGLSSSLAAKTDGVAVTADNFIHADSTRAYFKELDQSGGKVNIVRPVRELTNADNQDVIRMNSDTLYTRVILDVKGGASITTKEYEGFQNINVIDVNHSQIASLTGHGTLKVDETMLTEGQHVYVIVRTGLLRKLSDKDMMAKAHKAQDNISIAFKSSEPFVPTVNYDYSSLDVVKYEILKKFALSPQKDVAKNGLGTVKERDPDAARVVVAIGWGALSGIDAAYAAFTGFKERVSFTITDKPDLNDTGFVSFTIYNADGYIATINYAVNSDDMVPNKDGSYTVTFLASGEPVKEGEKNVVRTPRGKFWTGVLRAYNIKDKEAGFAWVDSWAGKMTEAFK
ncbi:MAG: DUF1214 domain-containing protein [Pseudomonadota bacterium]|nr:DUF1214 domain-containing protein [Pseudomonadota bacterium]